MQDWYTIGPMHMAFAPGAVSRSASTLQFERTMLVNITSILSGKQYIWISDCHGTANGWDVTSSLPVDEFYAGQFWVMQCRFPAVMVEGAGVPWLELAHWWPTDGCICSSGHGMCSNRCEEYAHCRRQKQATHV